MSNGLTITEGEFSKMKLSSKLELIFKNTEELKKKVNNYTLHQKIQYGTIGLILAILSFMANKIF